MQSAGCLLGIPDQNALTARSFMMYLKSLSNALDKSICSINYNNTKNVLQEAESNLLCLMSHECLYSPLVITAALVFLLFQDVMGNNRAKAVKITINHRGRRPKVCWFVSAFFP